ncbi:HAD family hydrolase [Streptacidiphilus jiangxiensis]|uniref:Putative hydrolase of the HAD superfamily n=1 Tax=Streptacidiphilus jiangxiensis TaxID=235985 RepID=A0A1H7XRX0_STRJI|nr:HAD family hydrolase [Streptacidiphilus jiangxiensis]SEM36501.1 putative hydrolase of the HAD superfamily [Streptacidiphilus jiangxiensis]
MAEVGVLWDIDDTLFDYSGAERAAILEHLDALGMLAEFDSPQRAHELWSGDVEAVYERFLAGELGFQEQRRVRVALFLGRIGRTAEDPDAWFAGYLDAFTRHRRVFDDVIPALDALPGYRHGLLSNSSSRYQEDKLTAIGLRDRFSSLVCSDEIGHAKPAPEAFWAGCAALGLPPEQVVYVGDKLTTDARGALAAGLRAVWLDRRGLGGGGEVLRIDTLADLPELLRVIDFGASATVL